MDPIHRMTDGIFCVFRNAIVGCGYTFSIGLLSFLRIRLFTGLSFRGSLRFSITVVPPVELNLLLYEIGQLQLISMN